MSLRASIGTALILFGAAAGFGRQFEVATTGSDTSPGTMAAPFRTIQHAAELAQPGDVITVHQGIYRERVNPRRGGLSARHRIVYQAAPGEQVVITGSEPVTNWVKVRDAVWKAVLNNRRFFGDFNPYTNLIQGDWFNPLGRPHHTGAVYLNGEWLTETASLASLFQPPTGDGLWFSRTDATNTTIWAQFKDVDPNKQSVEVNVRQTVFYPATSFVNYLTVRGFILKNAATPWAPPTAEQIGVIGTHWSKGWVIESNTVQYSVCSGIALGKYGDTFDNTSGNTADGYVQTIRRALTNGWNGQQIGHHLVRGNVISHCEQAGIVGSLGAAFSTVTGNVIHDIHVRKLFSGAEMAGIKFHGAVDVTISHNHIYRTCLGLWLDWMAQGARVSGNLFHDNGLDVFLEVDHGPLVLDNNLFLSARALSDRSQGVACVQNLFAGKISVGNYDGRQTPFLNPHSTSIAGFHDNPNGDDRYLNNLFVHGPDLSVYDHAKLPMRMSENVFFDGAKASRMDQNAVVEPADDPQLQLTQEGERWKLALTLRKGWTGNIRRKLVTSKELGMAQIPHLAFEQPDGAPFRFDRDYFGKRRLRNDALAGAFANPGTGRISLTVW